MEGVGGSAPRGVWGGEMTSVKGRVLQGCCFQRLLVTDCVKGQL